MTWFLRLQVVYFGYELLINGLIPTFEALFVGDPAYNDDLDPTLALKQHYFDLAFIFGLLWTFRSRAFPDYYHLGLREEEALEQ